MIVLAVIVFLALALALCNALAWPRAGRAGATADPVSVLIPARDEENHLGALLADLRACPSGVIEILVYDDHSTDGTAAVIERAARDDPRLRRIAPAPLPPDWRGKPFACAQLAAAASGAWLLFLDADARVTPDAPARIAAEAQARALTFLSCWPRIEMRSFSERWLMPMLNYVVFTLFPVPCSLLSNHRGFGLAHGVCILARAAEYRAIGGHALVKGELFEDTRLAQAWRAAGRRGLCLDGSDLVRVRMYDSFRGIWRGFSKNLGPAFRHRTMFALFLVYHVILGIAPFVALGAAVVTGRGLLPAAASVAGILALRTVQALRFGYPLWSALLHPFAVGAMLALAVVSRVRYESHGVEWKGRRYCVNRVRS